MAYCYKCGAQISSTAKFCENCGHHLQVEAVENHEKTTINHNHVSKISQDDPETISNRGLRFLELERYEEALSEFNVLLGIHPNDLDALYNRGDTLYALGHYQEALKDFDSFLELKPDDSLVHAVRGDTFFKLGRYQEALSDYNRSLELYSNDSDTLASRGNALFELEKYEEALNDYNRSLEIEPDNPDIVESRNIVLIKLKKEEQLQDIDKHHDLNWMRDFKRLYEDALQLSLEMQKLDKGISLTSRGSVSNMSVETRNSLQEFQEGFTNLAATLSRMPKQNDSNLRKISRDLQDACRNYSGVCRGFIAWGERPTKFNEVGTIELLKKADKYMEKVNGQLTLISNAQYTSVLKPASRISTQGNQDVKVSLGERLTEGRDINYWLKAIKSRNMDKRLQAIFALQHYEDTDITIPAFIEALHDRELKDIAAKIIRNGGDSALNQVFRELNDESKGWSKRCDILHALFDSSFFDDTKSHKKYIPPLINLLQVQDAIVRMNVIRILSWLGPEAKDAVPYLKDALSDSDERIRIGAATALKEIEDGPTRSL